MRVLSALMLVPALAAAQAQKPLGEKVQGWMDKAKAYLPAAVTAPADAGAAVVAAHQVSELTTTNWEEVLRPRFHEKTGKLGPDNYMVLVTGGNSTCFGQCEHMEAEFNKTAALLSVERDAPHLAVLDCDRHAILCSTWFAGPPTLWYIQFLEQATAAAGPVPAAERPEVPIHIFRLNTTSVSANSIAKIHREKSFISRPQHSSLFHPWDGQFAKLGIQKYVGYAIFGFSKIPSWALMLLVTFVSRSFMNHRFAPNQPRAGATTQGQQVGSRPLGGAPPASG